MNPSTALARVLVDELIANGVTDAVLAPGSRNAPFSLALADADAAQRIRLHVRIDERTGGFLALGLARASGRPVAVFTTSGTAVANLHPAVLEAHHGGVPLLLVTADRPPRLRDQGANQTVDQTRIFGPALRFFHEFGVPVRSVGQNGPWRAMVCRAVAHASGVAGVPGPAQLNVPLDEPLLPDEPAPTTGVGGRADWPESLDGADAPWTGFAGPAPSDRPIGAPEPGEHCLFIADLTHPAAGPVAAAGHPVVSEAGGAAGRAVLSAGISLLTDRDFLAAHRPDRIVVLGRPTLFRPVSALLAHPDVVVDIVSPPALAADPAGRARTVSPALARLDQPADDDWGRPWRAADGLAAGAITAVLGETDLAASPRLARDLVATLPDGTTLVLGSSQVPRDIGRFSTARDGVRILANRGVAGIDGTVSTAVGAALATGAPTVALMGDLTFLHDLTGLVIGPHEPRPDLTIVVSQNDGGAIFATLEPGAPDHARHFERVFGTPHGASLAQLAEGVGVEHLLVTSTDELADAVGAAGGIRIVEVPTTRTDLRELLDRVEAAVGSALRSAAEPTGADR